MDPPRRAGEAIDAGQHAQARRPLGPGCTSTPRRSGRRPGCRCGCSTGSCGGAEREVLFDHDHGPLLWPARKAVFEAIAERVERTVDALCADPAGRHAIHSDLHHGNVKVHRGRLRPLDFYEVIRGHPVQDVALTLHDLRFFTDTCPHGYPALGDAFRLGYQTRLPWPEQHAGEIDTLIAGRRLRTANYRILQHEAVPNVLIPLFEQLEAEFRAFLGTS